MYVPQHKYKLVFELKKYYPDKCWDKYPKKQLKAIYINVVNRIRRQHNNVY